MLYIVIPAYNEQDNIEAVVAEWHAVVAGISEDSRLVVIDDGSKDDTYSRLVALEKRYPLLEAHAKPNSGHGATLLFGYKYALESGADYIFQTDSDGQTIAEEFWSFWKLRHESSVIIGDRTTREDGISRVVVTKVLKAVIWTVFGEKIPDVNTPFRLMRADTLRKYISQVPEDFNLSNVMLSVMFSKYEPTLRFIPITFLERQGGVNSINLPKITKIGIQAIGDFLEIKKGMKIGDE